MNATRAEPFSLVNTTASVACAAASGYEFRLGEPPSRSQLFEMCGQDDCIKAVNGCLLRGKNGPSRTDLERRQLSEFAYPIVDFCYYYRESDQPCASDFLPQLLTDLQELVTACETKSGFSFAVGPTEASAGHISDLCGVDECDNLMRRLYVKPFIRSCEPMFTLWTPSGNLPLAYAPVMNNWVYPYREACPVALTTTWYLPITFYDSDSVKYVYLPGPLPGEASTTAPPSVEVLTPVPSKTPVGTPQPADTPSPEVSPTPMMNPSTSLPPSATVTSTPATTPTLTSPQTPRTTSKAAPTPSTVPSPASVHPGSSREASSSSSGEDSGSQSSSQGVAMGLRDVTRPSDNSESVPAPTLQSSSPASSSTLAWTFGSGAAAIVVMIFAFVMYRRRQRSCKVAKREDHSYRSLTDFDDTSSTVGIGGALLACPEIPVEHLQDVRIIGGGGNGIVYLVRDTGHDNRLLASKRTNKRNVTGDEVDAFIAEITLAASLSHPCIVQFIAIAGLHKSDLQGLFEYMPGGDLCRYLSLLPPVDPSHHSWTPEKLQIAIDIADALVYIHSITPKPVVHRDLKSRNVMLTSDHRAKLGDFGVSRVESEVGSMTTGVGTSRWVAPEVILGGGDYSTACDMYSFGVVLTELDTQCLPFSELVNANGDQLPDFVVLELVATQRQQPSLSHSCPTSIRELAQRCLSFEPGDRPSAEVVAEQLRHIYQEVTN